MLSAAQTTKTHTEASQSISNHGLFFFFSSINTPVIPAKLCQCKQPRTIHSAFPAAAAPPDWLDRSSEAFDVIGGEARNIDPRIIRVELARVLFNNSRKGFRWDSLRSEVWCTFHSLRAGELQWSRACVCVWGGAGGVAVEFRALRGGDGGHMSSNMRYLPTNKTQQNCSRPNVRNMKRKLLHNLRVRTWVLLLVCIVGHFFSSSVAFCAASPRGAYTVVQALIFLLTHFSFLSMTEPVLLALTLLWSTYIFHPFFFLSVVILNKDCDFGTKIGFFVKFCRICIRIQPVLLDHLGWKVKNKIKFISEHILTACCVV